MAHLQFLDELVKEYLLSRGLSGTLKTLDVELKADKDKGFRVDKIVDQLASYITSSDLSGMRELWLHLQQHVFSRLETNFVAAVKKLDNSLLKLYVVTAVQSSRHDKVVEFFERMASELQGQAEWKEWFVLPFIKNPEENPHFAVHFTKQWQDTLFISLHNFLAVVFQCMLQPTLASYEEESSRITKLQEENETLRTRLAALLENPNVSLGDIRSPDIPAAPELMDDFCVIAQETPCSDGQLRSLKNLIKNFGSNKSSTGPVSPNPTRKPQVTGTVTQPTGQLTKKKVPVVLEDTRVKPRIPVASSSTHNQSRFHVSNVRTTTSPMKKEPINDILKPDKVVSASESQSQLPFLLLSQDEYCEHRAPITHCKFNVSGSIVASSDMDGMISVWTTTPSPQTVSSISSKTSVTSLEWVTKNDRYFLHGNKSGAIRLYDTKEKKNICEVGTDATSPLKDKRVMCLSCNPAESFFICSASSRPAGTSKLLLYDLKTMKLQHTLPVSPPTSVINCSTCNHNGQLLVTGSNEGRVRIFDLRCRECIVTWPVHQGEVLTVQLAMDETSCYSIGTDGKLVQWSIHKKEQKLRECSLHERAAGPFLVSAGQQGGRPVHHRPYGKLFAFEPEGRQMLTCSSKGGVIYDVSTTAVQRLMTLGGHSNPVVTVDWATVVDCGTCLTAGLDGRIQVSTLLNQKQ